MERARKSVWGAERHRIMGITTTIASMVQIQWRTFDYDAYPGMMEMLNIRIGTWFGGVGVLEVDELLAHLCINTRSLYQRTLQWWDVHRVSVKSGSRRDEK